MSGRTHCYSVLFISCCCYLPVAMVNNAGESPKDLAKRYGHENCVDLLGGNSGSKTVFCIHSSPQLVLLPTDAELTDEEEEPEPLFEPGALGTTSSCIATAVSNAYSTC